VESDQLSLSPRERIKRLYSEFQQPRSFEEDERLHRMTGYVIETEDAFVMGRPVKHDAPWEAIVDPQVSFARHVQDAWFLHAMAGSLRAMWAVKPYYLPMIGWSRRGRTIRWYWIDDAHHAINVLIPPSNFLILTKR